MNLTDLICAFVYMLMLAFWFLVAGFVLVLCPRSYCAMSLE